MAVGDFLVRRNNADTSVVPNAGTDLDADWDTQVGVSGSGITYSGGVFTLADIAAYVVLFSDRFNTTDTTNNSRIEIQARLVLDSVEQVNGSGQAYIRKASGQQDGCIQSAAIIRTTGTDTDLITRYFRTDSSTSSTPNRVANYGGSVTIIQLSDTFNYARYIRTTNTALPSTAAAVTFDSNAQEDAGFSRSGATITITTAGRYLATYNSIITSSSTSVRQEPLLRISLDGGSTIVDGTWSQTFMRGNESTQTGAVSWVGVIDVGAGDTLQLIENDNAGTQSTSIDTVLNIVQLPVDNETFIIGASTNNFNTAAATDFQWATATHLDTDAFTYSINSTNVDVDNDDDYLVFASQSNVGAAASRAYPTARFAVNDTINTQAVDGSYGRSSGNADAPALNIATLLVGLSTNDSIESVNDSLATNTTAMPCSSGQFSGIRLSSLFAAAAETITAESGSYLITGTDTEFKADYNLSAEIGSYTVTGATLNLSAGYVTLMHNTVTIIYVADMDHVTYSMGRRFSECHHSAVPATTHATSPIPTSCFRINSVSIMELSYACLCESHIIFQSMLFVNFVYLPSLCLLIAQESNEKTCL